MSVAAWRVWLAADSPLRTWGLALFLVQLVLNLAWSWIFFRAHNLGAALAEVALLWVAIGITTIILGTIYLTIQLAVSSVHFTHGTLQPHREV
jgi:tryptophan-rich sensory protein